MNQKIEYKRRDFLSLCCTAPFSTSDVLLKGISNKANRTNEGRRVVTGINVEGKSVILKDGIVPENAKWGGKKINGNVLWTEPQVPVDLSKNSEPLEGYKFSLEPPQGGFTIHILTLVPGFNGEYHQTNTIDFVFIISGKLELILEKGATILSPGDTVIQRGTNHAWRVIGDEPCTLAGVMISAIKS
jgi:quercetin dioxygenase-like cupin family protein